MLNSIVSYNALGMFEPFHGTCLGLTLSKACQYVTIDDKVALGF
jgi:hypothetical protein